MNGVDPVRLQAFLLALSQLDVALSQELHQAIQRIGVALASDQTNVDPQIEAVLQQHYRLRELYEEAYEKLRQQPPEQQQATLGPDYLPLLTHEMAVPILVAEDFPDAAREVVKQAQQAPNLPYAARWFSLSLQGAVETGEAKTLAVLKALEKRPLPVKGLVYVVGLTMDQVWLIVQSLWQKGYIDRVTANIIYKIFPMLKDRQTSSQSIDDDTYLTLTAKGHFYLHPVVSVGAHKVRR